MSKQKHPSNWNSFKTSFFLEYYPQVIRLDCLFGNIEYGSRQKGEYVENFFYSFARPSTSSKKKITLVWIGGESGSDSDIIEDFGT